MDGAWNGGAARGSRFNENGIPAQQPAADRRASVPILKESMKSMT